jgi:hypothetical protein
MLGQTVVLEIRRLLAEGQLSHRASAKRVGVSRGMVHLIAVGRRRLQVRDSTIPAQKVVLRQSDSGIPVRCPGCGGKVYLPCLLCKARARSRRNASLRSRTPRRRATRAA